MKPFPLKPEEINDPGLEEDFYRAIADMDEDYFFDMDLPVLARAFLLHKAGLMSDYQLFREIHESAIDVVNEWIERRNMGSAA